MQADVQEIDVLQSLLPQYQAEGFEVYVNPSPSILPPFMHASRPDAVAIRADRKIAIQIVRSQNVQPRKLRHLENVLANHPDWELRVVYVSSLGGEPAPATESPDTIDATIQTIGDLRRSGHLASALVMAWATLEAIGRTLLPERFRRPQTPARLVDVLAEDGYLTPTEADTLRNAISLRNSAVHGNLRVNVPADVVDQFEAILRTLAGFLSREPA